MRHLNLPLPMDTNSSDERNFLPGATKMPVPYHLDESDSDSIVSRQFSSDFFYFLCVRVYQSECSHRTTLESDIEFKFVILLRSLRCSHVRYVPNLRLTFIQQGKN